MIQPEDVVIHHLIIHDVNHTNKSTPILSGAEPTLNPSIRSDMQKTIAHNFNLSSKKAGRFTPPENPLSSQIDEMLQDTSKFVPLSRTIAGNLFSIMKGSRYEISAGNLMLSDCSINRQRYLALLKMDPQTGYRVRMETIDGLDILELEAVEEILPTGELQKCAFILEKEKRSKNLELHVVDRQSPGSEIAHFFLQFLQCEIDFNSYDMCRNLYITGQSWIRKNVHESGERDRLIHKLKESISGTQVDIDQFANQQLSMYYPESFVTAVVSKTHQLVIPVSSTYVEEINQYFIFKGDHGTELKIKGEVLKDSEKYTEERYGTNQKRITLTMDDWELIS